MINCDIVKSTLKMSMKNIADILWLSYSIQENKNNRSRWKMSFTWRNTKVNRAQLREKRMLIPVCDLCGAALLVPGAGSELDTTVSSLPCGHVYHTVCIRRHVASCYECKVCHCPVSLPSISNLKLTAQEAKGYLLSISVQKFSQRSLHKTIKNFK